MQPTLVFFSSFFKHPSNITKYKTQATFRARRLCFLHHKSVVCQFNIYEFISITLHQHPNQAADSLRESPYDCCYLWVDCKTAWASCVFLRMSSTVLMRPWLSYWGNITIPRVQANMYSFWVSPFVYFFIYFAPTWKTHLHLCPSGTSAMGPRHQCYAFAGRCFWNAGVLRCCT